MADEVLEVKSFSPSEIVVRIPPDMPTATYLLKVSAGGPPTRSATFSTVLFGVSDKYEIALQCGVNGVRDDLIDPLILISEEGTKSVFIMFELKIVAAHDQPSAPAADSTSAPKDRIKKDNHVLRRL